MSDSAKSVRQGETLLIEWTPSPLDNISDWGCSISVRETIQSAGIIERTITDTSTTAFLGWLTKEETAALGVGEYVLCAKLTNDNTTPPYAVEHRTRIIIKEGCA